MALIEYNPDRVQIANQIRELRADSLNKLSQVELNQKRIRLLQEQMAVSASFTKDDLDEVDAVVAEIQAAIGDQGAKAAPVMRVPEPAPVEAAPVVEDAPLSPLLAAEEPKG